MILTCPNCATQYVVKDTAIPPQGRQVRCAACQHRWHQDPADGPAAEVAPMGAPDHSADVADNASSSAAPSGFASGGFDPSPTSSAFAPAPAVDEPAMPAPRAAEPLDEAREAPAPVERGEPAFRSFLPVGGISGYAPPMPAEAEGGDEPAVAPAALTGAEEDDPVIDDPIPDHSAEPVDWVDQPYVAPDEDIEVAGRGRRWPVFLLVTVLLLAAAAGLAYFLGGPALLNRVGLAAGGAAPLEVMVTANDRQKLASGNELLAVSGRIINPTGREQKVPPLTAELKDGGGRTIYTWTIAPPAGSLAPGASASFNSAEMNVPQGGDRLTVRLGTAKG